MSSARRSLFYALLAGVVVISEACSGVTQSTLPASASPQPAVVATPTPAAPELTPAPPTDQLPSPFTTVGPLPTAEPSPPPPPTAGPTVIPTPAFGEAPTGPTEEGTVVRVVDGDTIHVLVTGTDYTVRYIGMDTPETVDPNSPVQWMGPEASRANKQLVDGQRVVLEKDVSETDRYGRLLRYVWLHDGDSWQLVNLELVALGFAQVSTYPPDVKYVDLFLSAQQEARQAGLGLWGAAPPTANPTKKPPSKTPKPTKKPSTGNCDPSYPTVCIPPPPPDLNCDDVPFRRFKVLPPDPHHFDGDHDGIGCESG